MGTIIGGRRNPGVCRPAREARAVLAGSILRATVLFYGCRERTGGAARFLCGAKGRGATFKPLRKRSAILLPTSYESRVTDHVALIGTPQRLETHASHRKQTAGAPPNRYSSHRGSVSLRSPSAADSGRKALRSSGRLPDTANRVETCVTHSKQKAATRSTRDRSRACGRDLSYLFAKGRGQRLRAADQPRAAAAGACCGC